MYKFIMLTKQSVLLSSDDAASEMFNTQRLSCAMCCNCNVGGNMSVCAGLAVCPPILQLVLLPWCPESPRYLLITKQWEEEARRGRDSHIRGYEDLCPLGYNTMCFV
jgi:hypothetical protein